MNIATKQQLKTIKETYPVVNFEYRFVKGGVQCNAYLMYATNKTINANNFKTQSYFYVAETKEQALKKVISHIYTIIKANTPLTSCPNSDHTN